MLQRIGLILIVVVLISGIVQSQSNCDGIVYANELDQFEQLLRNGENPADVFALVEAWASAAYIMCSDTETTPTTTVELTSDEPLLSYSSAELGSEPVIGPIDFPDGLYTVKVVTDGFFILQLEELEGRCEGGIGALFNLSQGIATEGASALFGSLDCRGLLQVSNVTKPWTLEFYEITVDSASPAIPVYTSDSEGLYGVIGLMVFEDGSYRVRVTTDGYFIGQLEEINGTCDIGFGSMFNLTAGVASNGAEALLKTSSCIAVFHTSNVTEPWTLEFEKIQ